MFFVTVIGLHSLELCIENEVSKLPSKIAFLLSEISHWFCNQCEYF